MAMKVKIIGDGISGKAAESWLTSRGVETVVVTDPQEIVAGDFDFCVVSPGIPAALLSAESVPVIPEMELPFYFDHKIKPKCLIAVTGTNGKTTIVNQIARLCSDAGKPTVLCGNVGIPVSRVADKLNKSYAVMEVSSFMLEQSQILHPHIAVLSNITPDHLDRHGNLAEYIRCKQQIAARMKRRDNLIVNWDDLHARTVGLDLLKARQCHVIWYSTMEKVKGYYVRDHAVYEHRVCGERKLFTLDEIGGMPHTVSNALAVVAVGRRLGISLPMIIQAVRYHEQKHRIELVADNNGVVFYNDSKATNIASTLAAVNAFSLPVCLILCGLSKNQDYHELMENLPPHVQHVIVFGAIAEPVTAIATELQLTCVEAVPDLATAVQRAVQVVPQPGVVLFSPSGSSFDQFTNYEKRGEQFCQIVNEIIRQAPRCGLPTDANL